MDRTFDFGELLGKETKCGCGRCHRCDVERVIIERYALEALPALTADYSNITLVSDANTRRVCGEKVSALLSDRVGRELTYVRDGVLVPDEVATDELFGCIGEDTDLIVGVGAGVINDLCKYVSYKKGLPYFIVATAPSMDGYASAGAAMIFGGMKVTVSSSVPKAIVADTDVLAAAPLDMLRAGYGDIIGKYSCLNDWRLSEVVKREELCPFIYELTVNAVESVAHDGKRIAERDGDCIEKLMRALVTVGIAMAYMGNSRPASGSEHHLSHYFEVTGLLRSEPYFCHGIDVAYSTYVTAKLRRELLEISSPEKVAFDEPFWEENIRRVYRGAKDLSTAEGIIALQRKLGWIYNDRFEEYKERWEEIRKILSDSPTPDEVEEMLLSVGLSLDEFYKVYPEDKLIDGIKYSKDLKDRYTVLWLYNEVK